MQKRLIPSLSSISFLATPLNVSVINDLVKIVGGGGGGGAGVGDKRGRISQSQCSFLRFLIGLFAPLLRPYQESLL